MKDLRWMGVVGVAVLLGGCPRDGVDTAGATRAPKMTSAPTSTSLASIGAVSDAGVALDVSSAPISAEVSRGDAFLAVVAGNWSAPTGTTVYVQATDDGQALAAPAPVALSKGTTYRVGLALRTTLAAGTYASTVTVRACADAQCAQVYAGTTHSLAYSIVVKPVSEWQTMQGNAAHTGYLPITIDPRRFVKAWQWQRTTPGVLGFINSVATAPGKVLVSEDEYAGSPSLYALRASDGQTLWRRQFAMDPAPALSPPAYVDGTVYVSTSGHSSSYLWALNESNGLTRYQSAFSTQWANMLAPTVYGGRAYVSAGYYSGVLYAYTDASGASAWTSNAGTYGMNTPAVDASRVYIHNGIGLNVRDAATGDVVADIGTSATGGSGDYHGTVMLGSRDHAIAYSAGGFSGRASSSTEITAGRQLVDYSVDAANIRWMSTRLYHTIPATAKGVVYAASNESRTLDALDEATGRILWSWTPPEATYLFHRNVLVTDNVVFVSTDAALYAVDLKTRRQLWRSTTPGGAIAISADRMLYVATGGRESTGGLVAYRLQ